MAEAHRLIKKYPNRRLYDTQSSAYVTLNDIRTLVQQNETFNVVDAQTGDDLTRSVLLQIVLEEESGSAPMFSGELLATMIRFHGSDMQGMMCKYLESNFKAFTDMQTRLQTQARNLIDDLPPH